MLTPLVQTVVQDHNYPVVGVSDVEAFLAERDHVVLFFSELMKPEPEAADVAVILPELERAFDGQFEVAAVGWDAQRELQRRYRFKKYPSLVFLRRGVYLGVVSGVLDWSDYLTRVADILAAEPSEPPPMVLPGAQRQEAAQATEVTS